MSSQFHNIPPEKKGTVLITGGTGFLGAYIIKELVEKEYAVRALRRRDTVPFFIPPAVLDQVEWVRGDILDLPSLEAAMEGITSVIHAAAMVSFSAKERSVMFKTNIEGTANVVNTALQQGVRRFIHVSSVAALGRTADGARVNEEKKWEESSLNTHYATSKYNAEMEVWRGIAEGLNGAVINPGTILGYGDWHHSSCAIFRNVYNEFPWYTNGINGFVAVEDVARATVLLLESGITGERFIATAENLSFRNLFTMMAKAFNKRAPYKEATPFLAAVAWRLEKLKSLFTGRAPLLTRETAGLANTKTCFDNSKILHAFNGFSFTPLEISVRDACTRYFSMPAEYRK